MRLLQMQMPPRVRQGRVQVQQKALVQEGPSPNIIVKTLTPLMDCQI